MNLPAISPDDLPVGCLDALDAEADPQDDLIRQLAERARTQRLKHQLQRVRREPALPSS
jgi:hypothetical protein